MLKYLARYKRKQFPIYAPNEQVAREKAIMHLDLPEERQGDLIIVLNERYAASQRKRTTS